MGCEVEGNMDAVSAMNCVFHSGSTESIPITHTHKHTHQ
jgi:hypothetical protein